MTFEVNPTALTQALLESAEVKGYCADSPTMADKASSVHRFIADLFAQMEKK